MVGRKQPGKSVTVACQTCGAPFTRNISRAGAFCSRACRGLGDRGVNNYRVDGEVVFVDVSTPRHPCAETIIDLCDLEKVIDGGPRWRVLAGIRTGRSALYVRRDIWGETRCVSLLHRLIAGTPDGLETDHIDGDGLNNRRLNLRPATRGQNGANVDSYRGSSSIYKGVTWHDRANKWAAQITHNKTHRHLGTFASEEDAARAYDEVAKILHGAFARLNFQGKQP